MDLCLAAKRRPELRVAMWWWEQEGLEFEGMRMAAQEAEWMDGEEEETDGMDTATDD